MSTASASASASLKAAAAATTKSAELKKDSKDPAKAEDAKSSPPSLTATCIRSHSMEPDVVIVVGGHEFREYSQYLCCWSGYFDAAFQSGMKEATTKRFEFPDRDPKEWEWIVSLMAPLSDSSISKKNVAQAIGWFDLLCCDRGLRHCDKLLAKKFLPKEAVPTPNLESTLTILEIAINYNLPRAKTACCKLLQNLSWKLLTLEELERLLSLVQSDGDCREALWETTKKFLPAGIQEEDNKTGELPETISVPIHEYIHLKALATKPPTRYGAAKKKASFFEESSSEGSSSSSAPPKRKAPAPAPRVRPRSFLDSSEDEDSDHGNDGN